MLSKGGRTLMSLVPFDDRDGWIWLDGQFVPWREAKVHVLTHGLHYASAVFEGERMYGGEIFELTAHTERLFKSAEMLDFRSEAKVHVLTHGLHYASAVFEGERMYGGEIFELTAHTERLFKSAEMLDFEIPFTVAQIGQACKDTCAKNGLADAYVRPIAWRGSEMIGVSAQDTKIHVAIAVWDWPSYFKPEEKAKGIRMTWAKYKRPSPETEPVHAKASGLYMICTISKHLAEKDGYTDAMMLDYRGYVAESTGSNVFFVKAGVIHTPLADCFLNGITRQSVIKLARAKGLEVIERHIKP